MAANTLDYNERIEESQKRLETPEGILGKGLFMPFVNSCSGSRKVLASVQRDHVFPLIQGEKAIIETGYENRFGDYSSSILESDSDYVIVKKISKFSFAPNHHYWLILRDMNNRRLDVCTRISYQHVTEQYGYLFNNEYMDNKKEMDIIENKDIVQKSLAFDEYNNRTDGRNLNAVYISLDDNMEDSMIISDVAAGKLTSVLIKPIEIMINSNDIPLGIQKNTNGSYKIIPDIGEEIQDGIVIGLRKEKNNEALFAQSVENLKKIMLPDEIKQTHGRVLDIDVYCNNPDILDEHYYSQLKMYYNEMKRRSNEIIQTILPYVAEGYELSYELEKLFAMAKREFNGDMYIDKRPFNNIMLKVTVMEELKVNCGDKASNRYGGKGVFSNILPQKMMPRFKNVDGEYEYADVIINTNGTIGRENIGQIFELTLNHIGRSITDHIKKEKLGIKESFDLIYKFINFCSEQQAKEFIETTNGMTQDELINFLTNILNDKNIHLSIRGISDSITLDKIAEIYRAFPFIEQNTVEMPIVGSNNELRYVEARRKVIIDKQYFIRLKQFAEEKFMATSLSATNIKNQNVKSKAKKDYRNLYSNTPIRFGNMETNNQLHAGVDAVVTNIMIHSISPQGRRLVEQMYTNDPFKIDIKLDSNSTNRNAEIVTTYFKALGRRFKFTKRKRRIDRLLIAPLLFTKDPDLVEQAIEIVPEEIRNKKNFNYDKYYKDQQKELKRRSNGEPALLFTGVKRRFKQPKKHKD